ncbi:MAG: Ras guanine nucleotide exchange factor [archaeon]|nr:Ras guanine nucleotide exchange factor [archaeon]
MFGGLSRRRTVSYSVLPVLPAASGASSSTPPSSPLAQSPRNRAISGSSGSGGALGDDLALPRVSQQTKAASASELGVQLGGVADVIDEQVFKFHLALLNRMVPGEKADKGLQKQLGDALKLVNKTVTTLCEMYSKGRKRFPALAEADPALKDLRNTAQEVYDIFKVFAGAENPDKANITAKIDTIRVLCRTLRTLYPQPSTPTLSRKKPGTLVRSSLLPSPSFGSLAGLRLSPDPLQDQGVQVILDLLAALCPGFEAEHASLEPQARERVRADLRAVLCHYEPPKRSALAPEAGGRDFSAILRYDRGAGAVYAGDVQLLALGFGSGQSPSVMRNSGGAARPAPGARFINLLHSTVDLILAAHNLVWSTANKDDCRSSFLHALKNLLLGIHREIKPLLTASSTVTANLSPTALSSSPDASGGSPSSSSNPLSASVGSSSASDLEVSLTVEQRVSQEAAQSVADFVSLLETREAKYSVPALDEARSATRRGFLEKQLRRSIWIDANSVRVMVIRLVCTLHHLVSTGKTDSLVELGCTVLTFLKEVRRYVKHVETFHRIHKISSTSADVTSTSNAALPSIWRTHSRANPEKFLWAMEKEGDPKPAQGSINELVFHLTSDLNFERDYQLTFIHTYRSFTDPHTLFEILMDRFNIPEGLFNPQRAKALQLRVAVVVSHWVQTNIADFDQILLEKLRDFSVTLISLGFKTAGEGLGSSLRKINRQASSIIANPPLHLDIRSEILSPSGIILASSEHEIARQLTLIDYTIFTSIELSELLNLNWSSKSRAHRAQNVKMMLRRLNQCSHWFASMILWTQDVTTRGKLYTKILKVLQCLYELQNFNGVMSIVVAFNLAAVPRLKKTIGLVDSALIEAFHTIEALMSPTGSYKTYREALHSANGPCIPYIGLFLADLTFIEEGNPSEIDGLINFEKPNLIGKILRDLRTFQSNPYTFPPIEPLHSLLFVLPQIHNEKFLFEASLEREPRVPRALTNSASVGSSNP